MNRYNELRSILQEQRLFKLVCGAGNEDAEEVYNLALVYTLAGCNMIDLSAKANVVKACSEGIDKAMEIAPSIGIEIKSRPFIMVSVGLKGDPHVRKASIDIDKCVKCGLCIEECEQNAIDDNFDILQYRCIGCGKCADVCQQNAVVFTHKAVDLSMILPQCMEAGAESVELHAVTTDEDSVISDWIAINDLVPDNYISLCIDRSKLSNECFIERVKSVYDVAGDRTIIQADGAPMSGGKDDFNTTLQTIATADITRKSQIPVMLLASGGTNSKTGELADLCGVVINGVSLGTYARKIVHPYISQDDFVTNVQAIKEAASIARDLIEVNIKHMRKT